MAGRSQPGDLALGRFRIEASLGRGAAGFCFRARDLETERPVVVKELPGDRRDLFERYQGEAGLARDLAGDFADPDGMLRLVVPFATGIGADALYSVRDYVEGTSLGDRLRRGPLPEDEIRTVLADVCRALIAAHRENLVLRNLKPENVFLESGGRARVTGLGTGCFLTRARRESLGVDLGSLRYAAPEQILDARRVDRATDLFALGLLLYEAMAGQPAFPGGSLEAVLARAVDPTPPPPPPGSPALGELALRLLAHEPSERPNRAEPVLAELAPWVALKDAAAACDGCSHGLRAGAAYCPACGRAALGPCPHCGRAPGVATRFCTRCGQAWRPLSSATLRGLSGKFKGEVVHLPAEMEVTLGRAPGCTICFEERDNYVSRHQGRIVGRRENRWIEGGDWESGRPTTNGTLLNGRNLDGAGRVLLHHGDRLRVGDSFFRYEERSG